MKCDTTRTIVLTILLTVLSAATVGNYFNLTGEAANSIISPTSEASLSASSLPGDYYRYSLSEESAREMIPSWNVLQW